MKALHICVWLMMLSGSRVVRAQDAPAADPGRPVIKERPPYNRKEEIIHAGKRYRVYNNYLTLGAGAGGSSIRNTSQRAVGLDFHFHIRREYFQAGAMMSGNALFSNNHSQAHIGYGIRHETRSANLAAFAGPCYFTGVAGIPPAAPELYSGIGVYGNIQAVTKFLYDIGIGVDIFVEYNYKQTLYGFKIIAFFSGAYRGVKKNFNPNVRSENPGS